MIVYLITNKLNGKMYVGQTTKDIQARFKRHCWSSSKSGNMPIVLAIQKYGPENFSCETLAVCASQEELNRMEVYWGNLLDTLAPVGYNLKLGGAYGKMSAELRAKISKGNLGKVASDETRKKLSASHKGLRLSETTKNKLSVYWKGKPLPTKAKVNSLKATTGIYFFIDPEGMSTVVRGLTAFCKAEGLELGGMTALGKGRRESYKGWRLDPSYSRFGPVLFIDEGEFFPTNRRPPIEGYYSEGGKHRAPSNLKQGHAELTSMCRVW